MGASITWPYEELAMRALPSLRSIMTRRIAFLHTLHICALATWLAATVGTGIGAATAFPVMKSLNPRLSDFQAFTGDHAVIAGGKLAQRIFLVGDLLQFPASILAAGSLLALFVFGDLPRSRPSSLLRSLAIGIAVACLASLMFVVTPRLNAASDAHWKAAQRNDIAAVEIHRAAAKDIHPIASTLMATMAVSVLVGLATAAWSLARSSDSAIGRTKPTVQLPALAK